MPMLYIPEQPKLIVAEDHDLFRSTVIKELKKSGIQVIGEAANGLQLLDLLESCAPDIVLLDLEMPEMNGKEAFDVMQQKYPLVRIIIFSQHTEAGLMENYRARGAKGFLSKNFISDNISLLTREILAVHHGSTSFYVLEPEIKKWKYSRREVEIIPMICRGDTSKEIANLLGIGEKAVNKHRKELYRKTNTRNSAEFIHYALKRGLDFFGAVTK